MERMLGERARTPPPSSDGTCHFDMSDAKSDSVFFVIGMLSEHPGGRSIVEDDERVETFYCDEGATADLFLRRLVQLASEQGIDPSIRDEISQGCIRTFWSRALTDRLNSCYVFKATGREALARLQDGTYSRMTHASLGFELFVHEGARGGIVDANGLPESAFHRRRALAFLAGTWARYQREGNLFFPGTHDKAELVTKLLMSLGCNGISIESTVGIVPGGSTVRFTPTREVSSWLHRKW